MCVCIRDRVKKKAMMMMMMMMMKMMVVVRVVMMTMVVVVLMIILDYRKRAGGWGVGKRGEGSRRSREEDL